MNWRDVIKTDHENYDGWDYPFAVSAVEHGEDYKTKRPCEIFIPRV
jgi:hypothetical protein